MDPFSSRQTRNSSRPLARYGTVTFPAQESKYGDANPEATSSWWPARAVKSQNHNAYLVTRFASDKFVAKEFLKDVWSKPTIINGLSSHTKKSRNKVFRPLHAFRNSQTAAVAAAKRLLLSHLSNIQPDVLNGSEREVGEDAPTFGEEVWGADTEVSVAARGHEPASSHPVRVEVLECPIWMRHPADEFPVMKSYSTVEGELADIFAVTVTVLLREERAPDILNAWNQRNRFDSYVHVCIDRELAVAAWVEAIRQHGDKYFNPAGDIQIPGGQNMGVWPPEGRLDLYWEGKTVEYEAIFICVTSMCFESNNTQVADFLINSAIDKLQLQRDGFIGRGPNEDYALRMLQKMAPSPVGRQLRATKQRGLCHPPRHDFVLDPSKTTVRSGRNPVKRETSPDSSLSSAEESPERPDWADDEDGSSSTEEVIVVQPHSEPRKVEKETTPSPVIKTPEDSPDYLASIRDLHVAKVRTEEVKPAPRVVRRRSLPQKQARVTRSHTIPSHSGADRRRKIAEMNPEMEKYAKGL